MNDKLANQIARALIDLAKSDLDVGGFHPFDCYSVKDGANPNELVIEASHPGEAPTNFVVTVVRISSSKG